MDIHIAHSPRKATAECRLDRRAALFIPAVNCRVFRA
jgi:hypothetical protein